MRKGKKKESEAPVMADNLEIISIGVLYIGPWDKKYWSSSRGKDKYPYPVGYHAVRTHNGRTYKIEIHEGSKGPIFVISTDGQSSFGQTPEIAWDRFQKQLGPHVKLLHGKRLLSKIDGVDFFGFKNPLIQRLLRKLAAYDNGTAERSLLSSDSCNGASGAKPDNQHACTSTCMDLLPGLAGPHGTAKRSRKLKTVNEKTIRGARSKRYRSLNMSRANVSSPRQVNLMVDNSKRTITPSFKGKSDTPSNIGALPLPVNVDTGFKQQKCSFPVQEGLSLADTPPFSLLKDVPLSDEEGRLLHSSCLATEVEDSMLTENGNLARSQDIETQQFHSAMATESRSKEAPPVKDYPTFKNNLFYVADTLDHLQDNASLSATSSPNMSSLIMKSGSNTDGMGSGVKSPSESCSEEEIGTSTSNASSGKGDFDSVGQDMAKSMMTVLLPQALPLLNKFSRRKKASGNLALVPPTLALSHEEKKGADNTFTTSAEVRPEKPSAEREGESQILTNDRSSPEHLKFVVPDSCEHDNCDKHVHNQASLFCDAIEPDQHTIEEKSTAEVMKLFGGLDNCDISPVCRVETSICPDITMALKDRSHDSDIHIARSSSMSTLFRENALTDRSENSKSNSNWDLFNHKPYSEGKEGTTGVEDTKGRTLSHGDVALFRNQILATSNDSVKCFREGLICSGKMPDAQRVHAGSGLEFCMSDSMKFVGCYVHQMPVLTVQLGRSENEIYMCVLCGILMENGRNLLIYKLSVEEPRGCPCFIGHVPIVMPLSKDIFGRQIALERSGLQFTPDGKCLVLLDCIKVPLCREQKMNCLCSRCALDCAKENTIKIVQVKLGYVSVRAKLKTTNSVCCLLVCEPYHLMAVESDGRLHIWLMNLTWSAHEEEFFIASNDCISPCVMELKKIPNCAHLVVGSNGFGDFGLWDISKHIFVARFSAPNVPVFQFVPISLCSWPEEVPTVDHSSVKAHIERTMTSTRMWFSDDDDKYAHFILEKENVGIWLLVSTDAYPDEQQNYQCNCNMNPFGWWRLALLHRKTVTWGCALDPRAVAIGASAGFGILATGDGLVHMLDLATGIKLGTLHYFQGSSISCIATDNSSLGVVAIAGGGGKLLVYLHSENKFAG